MPAFINVSNTWRSVASLRVNVSNTWRTVTNGYVNVAGTWRTFFTSALTPAIQSPVTISRNNATLPSTLTGTNFHWTNSTSLTYVFQKSSDNVNFTNIGSAAVISNPSSGSSNTVTYALTLSDFPATISYFRFVVTAVNSTFSTSATSTSSSVSVDGTSAPSAPQNLTRSTGNGGSKTFTWSAPLSDGGATITSYQYQINNLGWLTTSSNTSQSVTLAAGANTFQVRAVNSVGAGTPASTGSFTVPTINSGPTASSITSSSATISWTSSNQSSYSLSISGDDTLYIGTTATSRSITGLAASTSYTPTLTITSATSDTATTAGTAFDTTAAISASNLATADGTATPGDPSSITVANTANANEGKVSWTNGTNATSSWVSSVTPGSSFTSTDNGTLKTEQLFTITSTQASATATVNNKNNIRQVTVSWDQSGAASYSASLTISGSSLVPNQTFTVTGNASGSSASFNVGLSTGGGTIRANSVTVYSGANQTGSSSTFTPTTAPTNTPTDKTSSATKTGSITYTQPTLAAPTFGANTIFFGGFSGFINNYSVLNTYTVTASAGTLTIGTPPTSGSIYGFSVSGLGPGVDSTITVTVSRTGFTGNSATTTSNAATYFIRATGLGNTTAPYIRFVVGAESAQSIVVNVGRSVLLGGTKTYLASDQTYSMTNGVSANLDFSSRTGTTSNYYVMSVRAYSGTGGTGSLLASFASTTEKRGSDTTTTTVYVSST